MKARKAMAAYLDAWSARNSRSSIQGTPTLSSVGDRIRVCNDVFDITVTPTELARMTENIRKKACSP